MFRTTIVTAVAENTGDVSTNAYVKIRRLINSMGYSYCAISDWHFTRDTISFNITQGTRNYSGASYLPATFDKVLTAKIEDSNSDNWPLDEKSVDWYSQIIDPTFQGTPYAFVLTELDASTFQEICFYYCPDATYTAYLRCKLKWSEVSDNSTALLIPDSHQDAFIWWVSKARFIQQGDVQGVKDADEMLYGSPLKRKSGLIDIMLGNEGKPQLKRGMKPSRSYIDPMGRFKKDYGRVWH